jgi:uncharacterized membrane protein YphA (DoxX/SURF4 family)
MFHLVTPFPFLLDFSFYAPLLLRLTLGVYILAIGFSAHQKNVNIIASEGSVAEVKPELNLFEMAYRGIFILAGISLIVGFYLQLSAIIIAILLLIAILDKRARLTNEIARAELTLLLVIALSLMLTGAGPFAFDLPL